MESEWLTSLGPGPKGKFRAKRYMDDLICFFIKNNSWNYEKFVEELTRSECYMPPLKLVEGKPGTFLENEFEITTANTVRYWLKNEADANFAWKYAHADSHAQPLPRRKQPW